MTKKKNQNNKNKRVRSEAELKAIQIWYINKRKKQPAEKTQPAVEKGTIIDEFDVTTKSYRERFPKDFPFWARLKICKNRTTLVIDEEEVYNKQKKRMAPGFVHRESIHPYGDGSNVKGYEKIEPNPDSTDNRPMYLKRPTKLPIVLFNPHNKNLDMPEHLRSKYESNNKKV